MSNLIDNFGENNYNSDEDIEGRGGLNLDIPALRPPELVPIAHTLQNATTDLLFGSVVGSPHFVWELQQRFIRVIGNELFSVGELDHTVYTAVDRWQHRELRLSGRTEAVFLNHPEIFPLFINACWHYLLHNFRRQLRIHVSFVNYFEAQRNLCERIRIQYFIPDYLAEDLPFTPEYSIDITCTTIYARIAYAIEDRDRYAGTRQFMRNIFLENRYLEEEDIPCIGQRLGEPGSLVEEERQFWYT